MSLWLFERARSEGDEEAWSALIALNTPWLRSFLASRSRDVPGADVEEMLEEVFFRVFRAAGGFRKRHPRSFVGWLFVIADNVVREERRAARRRFRSLDVSDPPPLEGRDDPRTMAEQAEEVERLQRSLCLLRALVASAIEVCPERLRQVFVLRHGRGLSYDEIAMTLGIGRGCVANRLHRARRLIVGRVERVLRWSALRAAGRRRASDRREAAG